MSHVSVRGEQSSEDEIAALESLSNLASTPAGQAIVKTGPTTFDNEVVSGSWDSPIGDATFTYDVNGNVDTKTVGSTVLTFSYDVDGNVDTITDGVNIKTFSYDISGNLENIIYT